MLPRLARSRIPIHDVAEQVAQVYTAIAEQRQQCDRNRVIELPYEQFCTDPGAFVRKIYRIIWGNEAEPTGLELSLQPFRNTNFIRLPPDEFKQLQAAIDARFLRGLNSPLSRVF